MNGKVKRTNTLNPKWLCGATAYNADGSKFGTVGKVNGDVVTVFASGTPSIMSAILLDKAGLIRKSNAVDKKFI